MIDEEMVQDSKRKTTQIATAGIIGAVVLAFMLYGVVKFFPVSSQITLLIQSVGDLEKLTAVQTDDIRENESNITRFQLSEFPVIRANIEQRLTSLDDVAGDNDTRVNQIEDAVKANTKASSEQRLRATRRIEQHKSRDARDDRTIERVDKIEERLEDFQTDQIQILIQQMQEVHEMIKDLQNP